MKEIIKHINGVAGRVVTVTGLSDPIMTRDNVLGILNGTQNEVLYVPMFYGDLQSVAYADGTLTITLADNVKAIANGDKLFVKLYADVEMAQEQTLTNGITVLQNAITALYGGDTTATLLALKTAIANISIDTTDLAKANALTAVQSDIDALEVLVGSTSDTSTDTTIFGKLAAVLAAIAGISGFATPTDVANAQIAIIGAMPSVSGLATETNATNNKQAILDAIAALSIPTDYAKETTAQQAAADAAAAKMAAQNAETTAQATANKNEIIAQIKANAGIPTLTIPDSTAEQVLAPNVLYVFETRTSTLTLTLGTPIVGIANEYHFFIVCGSTAPTINFPSGIAWNGENAPEIAADKTYEVSILNNIAAFFEV